MLQLFRTTQGIARADGEELAVLDISGQPSIAQLLADTPADVSGIPVRARLAMTDAVLRAPVDSAGRMFLLGLNYRSHIKEVGLQAPPRPIGLPISSTALSGPFAPIVQPPEAPDHVDYEGEIAIVVGRPCHALTQGSGWDHIAGMCVANDVSARDIQHEGTRDGQLVDIAAIVRAKSFPSFKPLGPCIVTADSVRDQGALTVVTRVNGDQRQQGSTDDMVFEFGEIVEALSHQTELHCGDVILTGTPAGVGETSGRFLSAGDVVEVDVAGIGTIRNQVTAARP